MMGPLGAERLGQVDLDHVFSRHPDRGDTGGLTDRL